MKAARWSCSIRRSRVRLLLRALAALALAAVSIPEPARAQYPNPNPGAPAESAPPGASLTRPRFSADAVIQPGDKGAPEVRIDYRLPRSELLFERTTAGYKAGYSILVIFTNTKSHKEVAGDTFTRDLRVARYSETTSRGEDLIDHVTFRLPEGKYRIDVALTDLTAERTSSANLEIEVPGVPAGQIWFTDLSFGTVSVDSLRGVAIPATFQSNPSRHYGDNLPTLAVTGDIVDNRPAGAVDSVYHIRFTVLSELQAEVAKGDTSLTRTGTRTLFLIHPRLELLDAGPYRFVLELTKPLIPVKGKKKATPIRREKAFNVDQSAASVTLDPRAALEVIRYIANEQELGEIDRLKTTEEKRAFWEAFWKRRDPTPDTSQNEAMDEFYRRVQYSNQQFGAGIPGWKTDRGRIYIVNGQPDEVVRNPFNFDRPPEEIWYYYRERKTYVFVDRDGFGRYELDAERSH